MLPCPFKAWSGLDCPGCGLQRSIYALLTGHAEEAFRFHPAGPVFLLLLILTALHLIRPIKYGHIMIITGYGAVALITVLFFSYKLANGLL